MLALILAVMTVCPILHGEIDAVAAYHNDDFSFVGSSKYRLRLLNPSPFDFATHQIVLVTWDSARDAYVGQTLEIPRTRVPAHAVAGVFVTFEDKDLDFRLLIGERVICDGIR